MSVLWNTDYDGAAALLITTHFPFFSIPHIVCVYVCSVNILPPFLDKTQSKVRVHHRLNHWRAPSYGCSSVNSPFPWAANTLLSHSSLYGIICPCLIYFQILGKPGILFHLYFHHYGMKDFWSYLKELWTTGQGPQGCKARPSWLNKSVRISRCNEENFFIYLVHKRWVALWLLNLLVARTFLCFNESSYQEIACNERDYYLFKVSTFVKCWQDVCTALTEKEQPWWRQKRFSVENSWSYGSWRNCKG